MLTYIFCLKILKKFWNVYYLFIISVVGHPSTSCWFLWILVLFLLYFCLQSKFPEMASISQKGKRKLEEDTDSKPSQKLSKIVNYQQRNETCQVCKTICNKCVQRSHERFFFVESYSQNFISAVLMIFTD